ncbi:MAG: thioesterase family protein [bacterium]
MVNLEFETTVRVRYADTDQMGVMYYANYLVLFEIARTEFLRDIGLPYALLEKRGLYLPVAECYCRYRAPAYYDDLLIVKTYLKKMSFVKMKFDYLIFRDKTERGERGDERENKILLAEGYTTHGFINKDHKVIRIPEDFKRKIVEREKGIKWKN